MNRSRLAALSAGAMFLVASVLAPVTAMAAGTGSLSLSPASLSTTTGSSFFVDIDTQASVPLSGASASIDFDKTKVQILSVTKGADWNTASANWVFPSAGTIATANTTGHLSAIGVFFNDDTNLPASTNHVLARVTFLATDTGTATINLPTTGSDVGALLDGTTGDAYGSPVATTSTGATITITGGSSGGANATTNVTGNVDAGFVALTCPTAVTIPLARNVNNVADFQCQIGSNVTWTLSALDLNDDPATHGYMRDLSQVPPVHLHQSLYVHANPHLDDTPPPDGPVVVYDSDVNLAASASAQSVATGENNIDLPLAFTQFAQPNDVAGDYSAQILFAIVSTF